MTVQQNTAGPEAVSSADRAANRITFAVTRWSPQLPRDLRDRAFVACRSGEVVRDEVQQSAVSRMSPRAGICPTGVAEPGRLSADRNYKKMSKSTAC